MHGILWQQERPFLSAAPTEETSQISSVSRENSVDALQILKHLKLNKWKNLMRICILMINPFKIENV